MRISTLRVPLLSMPLIAGLLLLASHADAAWSETRCATRALQAAKSFSSCVLQGASHGVRRDETPDYAQCERRLQHAYQRIERHCETAPPFPGASEIMRLFESAANTVLGAVDAVGGPPAPICRSATGFCTRVGATLDPLSPKQIAQIWLEATADMSGAHAPGGAASCTSAVAIALMECAKVPHIPPGTGIDTPICDLKLTGASGIWQVTSSDTHDLDASGCKQEKPLCDMGDPCCNARLAYAHAQLKCTASAYDPGTCTVNGTSHTSIPDCADVPTPNMPCYDGPFCLNTQIKANAPYYSDDQTTEAAIETCFPGLACQSPTQQDWFGWGAPFDYYHNSFCCTDAECGSGDSTNMNWNCFSHGQTDPAYACPATNPPHRKIPLGPKLKGRSGVGVQSTKTTGELAAAACNAVLANPAPEVTSASFEPCWLAPGYGADESSACVPMNSTATDPAAGCGPGERLLCQDPWNTDPATWGCEVGAPTPGFQGLTDLCGPAAAKTRDTPWLWNKARNSCVLRGGDYPLLTYTGCGNSKYEEGLDTASYLTLQEEWQRHARDQATPHTLPMGDTAYLVDISLDGGQTTEKAAMALGHGAMTGLCGDCFLIRSDPSLWGGETRYAVLLQADVRAWSFEISPGAQNYLFENTNCKGNATTSESCCIPDIQPIDCSVVLGSASP